MMQSICVDQEINLIKNKTNWNVKQRKWRKKAGDFWKKAEKKNKIFRIYKKISGKHVKRIEWISVNRSSYEEWKNKNRIIEREILIRLKVF